MHEITKSYDVGRTVLSTEQIIKIGIRHKFSVDLSHRIDTRSSFPRIPEVCTKLRFVDRQLPAVLPTLGRDHWW